jgi:EAL domain-containing protein (putative c-di-GMP-specific phosphodiesterase class I)
MYAAKRDKLAIAVWEARYDQHGVDRLSLMSDLRRAVDNDEFTLVYQPMVAFAGGGDHDVEALIRWRHPARGVVPPIEFIAFAEQTGYVRAITRWVLERAITQCVTWRRSGHKINVSVNISARDVMDAELPNALAALLERHGCAAHWISLEITENGLLDDPDHAIRNLERLHALGCKLAIDDFGTGYSSLSYLRRLPVQKIKIDKSFVVGMVRDDGDAAIVRSTIDLAHGMGLGVVAEGVEDQATFERLRSLGCDVAQGYWLSQPLTAAQIPVFVQGLPKVRYA